MRSCHPIQTLVIQSPELTLRLSLDGCMFPVMFLHQTTGIMRAQIGRVVPLLAKMAKPHLQTAWVQAPLDDG